MKQQTCSSKKVSSKGQKKRRSQGVSQQVRNKNDQVPCTFPQVQRKKKKKDESPGYLSLGGVNATCASHHMNVTTHARHVGPLPHTIGFAHGSTAGLAASTPAASPLKMLLEYCLNG